MRLRVSLMPAAAALFFGCGADAPPHGAHESPVLGGSRSAERAVAAIVDSSGKLHCSGVLIDADRVLTAAHCDRAFEVRFDVNVAWRGAVPAGTTRRVVSNVAHPRASTGSCPMLNDVRLLVLDRPIGDIAPLPLANTSPQVGDECVVAGYGRHDPSSSLGPAEHSLSDFVNERREARVRVVAVSTVIETRGVDGAHSNGDSGGPLLCDGAVAGVTSCTFDRTGSPTTLRKFFASVHEAGDFFAR